MNKTLIVTLLLAAFAVNAKTPPVGQTSPAFRSLRMIDAAAATLAEGGGKTGLPRKNTGDVVMASAKMTQNKSTGKNIISVDIGGHICSLGMTEHQPPKGITGASTFTASVIACTRYVNARAPDLMKYEDIRPALTAAASKGKVNLSFSVTPDLKVKFSN